MEEMKYGSYMGGGDEQERKRMAYTAAVDLMRRAIMPEQYEEAARMFESINPYEDSENLARICREKVVLYRQQSEMAWREETYAAAVNCMSTVSIPAYERAAELLGMIPGWRDANERRAYCIQRIDELKKEAKERQKRKNRKLIITVVISALVGPALGNWVMWANKPYNVAMRLYKMGNYEEAYVKFKELDDDDSKKMIEDILKDYPSVAQVGDCIKFGRYEQDNNVQNGKEDIEWIVYWRGGDSMYLASKYVLDCQPYDVDGTDTDWEDCSLNAWLNDSFYNEAFNEWEGSRMIQTQEEGAPKVYLLNLHDARSIFSLDGGAICEATPYAKAKGVMTEDGTAGCYWWIEDNNGECQYFFYDVGSVDATTDTIGVRPIIKIQIR